MDDEKYLNLAVNVAKLSFHKRRVGCVIVKHKKVISLGCNKMKFNLLYANPLSNFLHAEAVAIKLADSPLNNCTAYVARIKRNGTIGLAKPCVHCQDLLRKNGVKLVYFTTEEFPYFSWIKL